MRLIEEVKKSNINIKFYDGIDFNLISNHDNNDFLIFFVDNFIKEVKKWNRINKINKLTNSGIDFNPMEINNNYIAIYQTNGDLDIIYKTIRNRMFDFNGFWQFNPKNIV